MVTMNHLSVEDPGDDSPLLAEAVEAAAPGSALLHRQQITKPDSWDFFLSRYLRKGQALNGNICPSGSVMPLSMLRSRNLALSAVLLLGCYSAVLIPAHLPLKSVVSLSDNNHHKNQVRTHMEPGLGDPFFLSHMFLSLGPVKPISLPAVGSLSAPLVPEPPLASFLLWRSPEHPCVCAAGRAHVLGSATTSGLPGQRGAPGPGSGLSASAWPAPVVEPRWKLPEVHGGGKRRGPSREPPGKSHRPVWRHYQVGRAEGKQSHQKVISCMDLHLWPQDE